MSKPVCPCCGKPIERTIDPAVVELFVQLRPTERAIFQALAMRIGQWVPSAELLDALYGEDAEGGPETAACILSQYISRLRQKLVPFGLVIDGKSNWGDTGRRLRWVEA